MKLMTRLTNGLKRFFGNKRKRIIFIATVSAVIIALTVTLSVILTAEKTNSANIIYHHYDGTTTTQKITKGEDIDFPVPVREKYTFTGWYFDEKFEKKAEKSFFEIFDYSADLHLYEGWRITDPVSVTFNSNGGSMVPSVHLPRGDALETMQITTKEGYTLIGWCIDISLTNYYLVGVPVNENITIYAKWLPNEINEGDTVDVTFVGNGGPSYPDLHPNIGTKISVPEPIRAGYDFGGWYADRDFKYFFDADSVVMNQSLILYAKWIPNDNEYALTLQLRGGQGPASRTYIHASKVVIADLGIPTKPNDVFIGWYTDSELHFPAEDEFYIYKHTTLYAKYHFDENEYIDEITVYYNLMYDNNSDSRTISYGGKAENLVFSRQGYTFAGWYTTSELTTPYNFNATVTAEITLYAKWEPDIDHSSADFVFVKLSDESGEYYKVIEERNSAAPKTEITIPDTFNGIPIKEIAEGLFKGRAIEKVTLGENVRLIGKEAFAESLVSRLVVNSANITFDEKAFYKANNLTSLYVNGTAIIGEYAFAECSLLASAEIAGNVKVKGYAFYQCLALASSKIEYLSELGEHAFDGCANLTSVSLSRATIAEIPFFAFANCKKLAGITIPQSVKAIKQNSFESSGLIQITLDYAEKIEDYAFFNCGQLTTVSLGAQIQQIDKLAFLGCVKLSAFTVHSGNTIFSAVNGNLYDLNQTTMILYAQGKTEENFTVLSTVTTIDTMCFIQADNLKTIVLPANVATVRASAFMGNASLERIEYYGELDEEDLLNAVMVLPDGEPPELIRMDE